MRSPTVLLVALPAVVLLGACGLGSDDGASLSLDQLESTGGMCPVDLDAAAAAAGLDESGADVEVEVARGSGQGGQEASAIDRAGGVYVQCTRAVDDGDSEGGEDAEVATHLFASEQPGAIGVLLPLIQRDLGLTVDDLQGILDRFNAADGGDPIDLGAEGPATATRIDVDDAASAILYVSATEDAASPDQIRTITEHLTDGL